MFNSQSSMPKPCPKRVTLVPRKRKHTDEVLEPVIEATLVEGSEYEQDYFAPLQLDQLTDAELTLLWEALSSPSLLPLDKPFSDDGTLQRIQSPLTLSNGPWLLFDDPVTPTEADDSDLVSPALSRDTDSEPSEEEQEQPRQQKKPKINPPQPMEQPEESTPHRSTSANFNRSEARSIFDFFALRHDPEWLEKLISMERNAEEELGEEELIGQQVITAKKVEPRTDTESTVQEYGRLFTPTSKQVISAQARRDPAIFSYERPVKLCLSDL